MGDTSTAFYSRASAAPRSRGSRGGVEFFCEEDAVVAPRRRNSLDACSFCRRPLGRSRDIYMYRGDTPFCSEDCRQEQIDLDLAREEEEARHRRSSGRARRGSVSSGPAPAAAAATGGVLPVCSAEGVVAT
ncbi:hypothetical protein Taro_047832 [Colocasia esculenta]|uniref:FLZ-type domain-containing protein n=1 Tax=Colocasia esculenta TaxID=4460 RepID=A0A843WWH0_COLES|nr:hypothetical protein [Colocasia esculenta]